MLRLDARCKYEEAHTSLTLASIKFAIVSSNGIWGAARVAAGRSSTTATLSTALALAAANDRLLTLIEMKFAICVVQTVRRPAKALMPFCSSPMLMHTSTAVHFMMQAVSQSLKKVVVSHLCDDFQTGPFKKKWW